MRPNIPPIKRLPPNASDETRLRMYREYTAELVRLNPRAFLAPGERRRWWHCITGKMEYPEVLL